MAERRNRSLAIIGYILTPEFSSKTGQFSGKSGGQFSPQWRFIGRAKTGAWILFSIILSLALGQLN